MKLDARLDMASHIGALLDGALTGNEAADFLEAQTIEKLSPEQIAGGVDAVMDRVAPFPAFPNAIDCCGTGGDGRSTFNISTATAIVAASRGVIIAKHGNRSVSSRSGSADVLGALNVNTKILPDQAAECLKKIGLCFLFAPTFHKGFAQVAPIRKRIGHRTIFNLLGPLCNPARVNRQLIGVFAPELCNLVAEACHLLGRTHVMVVHGEDGTDEISITGNTHVATLKDGKIRYSMIRPQDAGLEPQQGRALIGGDAMQNAHALEDVLKGYEGAYTDAVLLNTAAVLMLAEKAPTLHEGVALAKSAIARGQARLKLDQLIEATAFHD